MKHIFTFLTMLSLQAFAGTEATCYLVNGVYQNSPNEISNLKFETVVDVFTVKNANSLSMNLDGENLRFFRTELNVTRQTQMVYVLKKGNKISRAIHLNIDRTPNEVIKNREFYGNMIITNDGNTAINPAAKNLSYNFYCNF